MRKILPENLRKIIQDLKLHQQQVSDSPAYIYPTQTILCKNVIQSRSSPTREETTVPQTLSVLWLLKEEAELVPILPSSVPESQRSIHHDLALLDSKLSPFWFEKSPDIAIVTIQSFENQKISHFQTPDNISRKLSRLEISVTMPSWQFSPSSPRETSGS